MTTIAIPLGSPVLTSGIELWPLDQDERQVLTGYRLIREQGDGSLAVEFRAGTATRWDVHPNVGSVKSLNAAILKRRRLRD